MEEGQRYRQIRKVTLVGSAIDLLLALVKLAAGFWGQSQALIADGIHSLSDLATDFVVLYAARHSSRGADESHPYGHGRFETIATVILGVALLLVAAGITWDAVERLFHTERQLQPGLLALLVAAISVISKEWIFHYTKRLADRLRSSLLAANAWHSRTDAISSLIVIAGVAGSMAGLSYMDSIAAAVVGLFVARIGWDLAWHGVRELVDTGLEKEQLDELRAIIRGVDGVQGMHSLRTRRVGADVLVDVHILVDPGLSVSEGHHIGEMVRTRLLRDHEEVNDVLVHIDPEDDEHHASLRELPLRGELLERLKARWADIEAARHIQSVTLHYLRDRIQVVLLLPLRLLDDGASADELEERFNAALQGDDVVQGVRLRFR
ncbi:MAG TPA: cation transporter [Gammaproteobacteria bacterium]|nr:cation transporter [Gammaproteobacteria bacterium]